MKMLQLVAAASLLAASSLANAAVTFDSATGTGFVGKGDVQLAFGWNNAQLQSNAATLAFSYSVSTKYSADCVWFTGPTKNRVRHEVTRTVRTALNGAIAYEARQRNQITGFNLTGFATQSSVGTLPVDGAPCLGEGTGGTWEEVTQVGESTDALEATHNGIKVELTITPPVL